MIYYRIALQKDQSTEWEWGSTVLTSLDAVFRLRQRYTSRAGEHMRVFMASSVEYMDILLVRENLGLPANSWSIDELSNRQQEDESSASLSGSAESPEPEVVPEAESEVPPGEDCQDTSDASTLEDTYDEPYRFEIPTYVPHMLAWLKLMVKVRSGELLP